MKHAQHEILQNVRSVWQHTVQTVITCPLGSAAAVNQNIWESCMAAAHSLPSGLIFSHSPFTVWRSSWFAPRHAKAAQSAMSQRAPWPPPRVQKNAFCLFFSKKKHPKSPRKNGTAQSTKMQVWICPTSGTKFQNGWHNVFSIAGTNGPHVKTSKKRKRHGLAVGISPLHEGTCPSPLLLEPNHRPYPPDLPERIRRS